MPNRFKKNGTHVVYSKNRTPVNVVKRSLDLFANFIFGVLGFSLCLAALLLAAFSAYKAYNTFFIYPLKSRAILISFVSYLVISVAIFDVGRYLVEEEVLRERELRSPKEARQSITKFMVIIVIAVTLEALLHLLRIEKNQFNLIFPSVLLFVAAILLVGLGVFQRLSASTEKEIEAKSLLYSPSNFAELKNEGKNGMDSFPIA